MARKKRIIVLEDDRATSHLIAWPLLKLGYNVVEVSEGRGAIEMAVMDRADLLISDVMLPDMKGTDALREILKLSGYESFKAIFITSLLTRKGVRTDMKLEIGGRAFPAIGKPIRLDLVRKLVSESIGEPN